MRSPRYLRWAASWAEGMVRTLDMPALAAQNTHSIAALTITVVGGSTVVAHGTDSVTLTGYAAGMTAGDLLFL
jgi:hypothetical protein